MFFAFIDGMAGKPNVFYAVQMLMKEKKVSFRMTTVRTKLSLTQFFFLPLT